MSNRTHNEGTKFEKQTIEDLGLTPYESDNGSGYLPDATLGKYVIECKSCNIDPFGPKGKKRTLRVSTARNITPQKIADWRLIDMWIIAAHENKEIQAYLCLTAKQMAPFIDKIENIVHNGRGGKYLGRNSISQLREALHRAGEPPQFIEKAVNTFIRGTNEDDPHWSWRKLCKVGTFVENIEDIERVLENE